MKKRRALISVYDKTGIVEFAQGLQEFDWEIISTGGTAQKLKEAGIPVIPIEEISGNPEAFKGRMKTISFAVGSGILFDRETDQAEAEKLGIQAIDMVVCNLYPFADQVAKKVSHQEIIENIDIGGPTMLRAAAKNYSGVLVLCDPKNYGIVLERIKTKGVDLKFREYLARQVFRLTAKYDLEVMNYFNSIA